MAAPTTLRDTRVKRFSPTGLSDSLDATDEFPGACASLSNLIPDLTTRNIWTCRPASTVEADFTACPNLPSGHTLGNVTVFKIVGSYAYGLFTDLTSDFDRPFCYNLATSSWITVTGPGFNPASNASFPNPVPTIDLVGVFLIVTHPGFTLSSGPNQGPFGWFNISTPGAPVWNTGDTASGSAITFAGLGVIPTWVVQFNQRAYFGANSSQPSVVATDVLSLKVTNAGQALTFGDNNFLTAAAPLGLSNQLGGIIQSLMVFKGVKNIYQITGDYALSNWTVNSLNVSTGTLAPRSIVSTPQGLAFVAPDGLRIIDQNGTVSDPIGAAGKGVTVPFYTATIEANPFIAAGCDGATIRVAMNSGSPTEYWFSLVRKVWSGPHTFSSSMFDTYNGQFIVAQGDLWLSPTNPNFSFSYVENGVQLTFKMQSSMLEDSGQMAESELAEMQVVAGSQAQISLLVSLLDTQQQTLNSASINVSVGGVYQKPTPYRVDFPAISTFNRVAVQITGSSQAGLHLGDVFMRLRTLSYVSNTPFNTA